MCPASPPSLAAGLWAAPLYLWLCLSTVRVQLSEGVLVLFLLIFLWVCLTVGGVGAMDWAVVREMRLWAGPFSPRCGESSATRPHGAGWDRVWRPFLLLGGGRMGGVEDEAVLLGDGAMAMLVVPGPCPPRVLHTQTFPNR